MPGEGEVAKIGQRSTLPAGNLQMIFGAEQFLLPLLFLLSLFKVFCFFFFLRKKRWSQYIEHFCARNWAWHTMCLTPTGSQKADFSSTNEENEVV